MTVRLYKFNQHGEKVFKDFGDASKVDLYGAQGFFCEPVNHQAADIIMNPAKRRSALR